MTRAPDHVDGFTLLEVLLALVLFAFVMVGAWGALRGATRITHSANTLMLQGQRVHTVQRFVRSWLARAQTQTWSAPGTDVPRMFRGSAARMRYVAPLPVRAGHSGLYLQTLELVPRPDGRYALVVRFTPYADGRPDATRPETHVLLTNLRGGSFQYLAAAAFGQPAAWHTDWTASASLPLAVRIRLDAGWPTRVPFPDLLVRLYLGTGANLRTARVGP